jgi:hypothetical protein
MKKISLFILLLIIVGISSCERDDICAETTATTPSLIITFYDVSDQEESKNVALLKAFGMDDDDVAIDISEIDGTNTDSIVLPLRTDVNETRFILHRAYEANEDEDPDNPDDDFTGNPDTISITYDREEVYVSRACGYKTIFKNFIFTIEEETDDPDDDFGNWMLQFTVEALNNTIENEATAHINIFH